MERAIYDRMATIDGEHWWFAARRRIVRAAIAAQVALPAKPRILEVGAGTGSNLAMLQALGQVDAIEPDDGARALASERSGLAVRGGLLPHGVTLRDGGYDLIVLLDVLEHIDDDRETLRVLRTKLAPGGRLLLTVPANPWMWSAHDAAHHHKRRYTVATLCGALVEGGFRLVHMSHFNSLLFPPIAAVRWWHRYRGDMEGGGDDAMPPRPINAMLRWLFGLERYFVVRAFAPFGVSLLAIAEPS